MQNNLPPGWSEDRVQRILECYKSGVESDTAEGETAYEFEGAQHGWSFNRAADFFDIFKRAFKYEVKKDVDEVMELVGSPRILIVGCGGAGNNTVTRVHDIHVDSVELIAIDTDNQDLGECRANKKILVGKSITRGLGAGGNPDVGRRAAELARGTLSEVLTDSDLVFVTAGMGGGTGTGVAPVVADIARANGAIVVGMVSTPFHVERARIIKAEKGLQELSNVTHTLIAFDNNRLLSYVPNLPMRQAFSVMDQLISESVKSISETITKPSLINLDYADIRTILSGGAAVILFGESKTRDENVGVISRKIAYDGKKGSVSFINCSNLGPNQEVHDFRFHYKKAVDWRFISSCIGCIEMDVPDGKKITVKNNSDMEFINHLVKCRMPLPRHIISDFENLKETPEEIIKVHDNVEKKIESFIGNIFMKGEIGGYSSVINL